MLAAALTDCKSCRKNVKHSEFCLVLQRLKLAYDKTKNFPYRSSVHLGWPNHGNRIGYGTSRCWWKLARPATRNDFIRTGGIFVWFYSGSRIYRTTNCKKSAGKAVKRVLCRATSKTLLNQLWLDLFRTNSIR